MMFMVDVVDFNEWVWSVPDLSLDQVAAKALSMGKGELIAKIDIKSAYRVVPVHPGDIIWLGMQWEGKVYVDGKLPFGLFLKSGAYDIPCTAFHKRWEG